MKQITLTFFLTLVYVFSFQINVWAGDHPKNNKSEKVTISGKIINGRAGKDLVRIRLLTEKNHLDANVIFSPDKALEEECRTDKYNLFRVVFSVPSNSQPLKMTMSCYVADSSQPISLSDYIIEVGDSIMITIEKKQNDWDEILFSGRGYYKFKCRRELEIMTGNFLFLDRNKAVRNNPKLFVDIENIAQAHELYDTSLKKCLNVLYRYSPFLKKPVLHEFESDIIGNYEFFWQGTVLQYLNKLAGLEENKKNQQIIKRYTLLSPRTASSFSTHSSLYIQTLLERSKVLLVLSCPSSFTFSIKDLYLQIKNQYSGIIRDKLLAACIMDNSIGLGINLTNYQSDRDFCIDDAVKTISTLYIKQEIERTKASLFKGSTAYNFTLPDTSGNLVSLSHFRGTVVLIDVWSTGCKGCASFSQTFEEKVLPFFKDSAFKVISINLDRRKETWIKSLNSGKFGQKASANLYTAGVGESHPFFKFYNIQVLPFILLVDRAGKIFAEINTRDTPETISTLIKQALKS